MGTVTTAIFIGGPLYSGEPDFDVIEDLKASGFNQVFAWAGLNANGDITYAGATLVTGGKYIDTSGFAAQLQDLKTSPTSVSNLQFMLGGWESTVFPDIKALIFPEPGAYPNNPQIGPDTVLYQNFQALKNAIPIDGINFDDETLYDHPTTVAFGQLLNSLGYQVTYNPYAENEISFWTGCLAASDKIATGLVSGFYLQCYAGGTGNDPEVWIKAVKNAMGPQFDAAAMVRPGLWCSNSPPSCTEGQCPDSIAASYAGWKADGIQYGWIWLWDDIYKCMNSGACSGSMDTAAYASAIVQGLS